MSERLSNFQVLGYASLGRTMFADMRWDYHRIKMEYEELVRAVAKYQEDLNMSGNELKRAAEVVKSCKESLLVLEKKKEYADLEMDWAKADFEKAKVALQEQDRALQIAARERDALKAKVAGIREKVVRA